MTDTPVSTRGRPRKNSIFAAKPKPSVIESVDEALEAIETVASAPPMRSSMREESPRERAAKRAAELRDHLGDLDEGTDEFYVDPNAIPDGWTYNWKRFSVYEQEDTGNQLKVKRDGWSPVPVERHPEMMASNTDMKYIMRKGMVLMECPTEIVDERKRIDLKRARDQVRYKESQIAGTPDGTLTRDHARVKPQIKKSYEAMPVPEE